MFRAVLCTTVVHSGTHTHMSSSYIEVSVGLGLGLVFVHLFIGLAFRVFLD